MTRLMSVAKRIGILQLFLLTASITLTSTAVLANCRVVSTLNADANFDWRSLQNSPQASFVYYPLQVYANITVTFDGSSSTAEGYNDIIIRYEWTFYDPYNPEIIVKEGNYTNPPSPIATHVFPYGGTFTVQLNVTDTEGLWSTASRPIGVIPESGPTANYTWTPNKPYANNTVAQFNASMSTRGWSAQTKEFSPIVSYKWNFSDGTGNITTSDPIISHIFAQFGDLSVYLTVTDAAGRTNTTFRIIEVLDYTSFPWDVTGDGYVGINDIFEVALHFGQTVPPCDPKYDITGDNYIGVNDIFEVATHFGEEAP